MYTTDLNHKLYMFLKHNISFNTEHNKYIFFDKWANEIDKSYFDEKISEIKQLLHNQLKYGLNNELVLDELVEMTGNKVNWFSETEIYNVSYVDSLALKNKSMDRIPPEQKIVSEFFIDYTEEEMQEYENKFSMISEDENYFYTLTRYAKELNNYQNPADLEKVQLMYCLELYKEAVYEIHQYIYQWQMNLPTTDLSKIDFEAHETIVNNLKCSSNWNKKDIARLFQLLSEVGIFYFDNSNSTKNGILMKKFIETNFTYYSTKHGRQHQIESINKEFSNVTAPLYKQEQVKFLDNLIDTIKLNRDQLKNN